MNFQYFSVKRINAEEALSDALCALKNLPLQKPAQSEFIGLREITLFLKAGLVGLSANLASLTINRPKFVSIIALSTDTSAADILSEFICRKESYVPKDKFFEWGVVEIYEIYEILSDIVEEIAWDNEVFTISSKDAQKAQLFLEKIQKFVSEELVKN